MTRFSKALLVVALVVAVGMALFPPWDYRVSTSSIRSSKPAGHAFIASPPGDRDDPRQGVVIAWDRLLLQWLALAGITVVLVAIIPTITRLGGWKTVVLTTVSILALAYGVHLHTFVSRWEIGWTAAASPRVTEEEEASKEHLSTEQAQGPPAPPRVDEEEDPLRRAVQTFLERREIQEPGRQETQPPILVLGPLSLHTKWNRWIITPSTPKQVQSLIIPGSLIGLGLLGMVLALQRARSCWRSSEQTATAT